MKITNKQNGAKGAFIAMENDKQLGEMTYYLEEGKVMVIDHTMVEPEERGGKIGLDLLNESVGFAKENNLKIKADCSFVQSQFKKHPEQFKTVIK